MFRTSLKMIVLALPFFVIMNGQGKAVRHINVFLTCIAKGEHDAVLKNCENKCTAKWGTNNLWGWSVQPEVMQCSANACFCTYESDK